MAELSELEITGLLNKIRVEYKALSKENPNLFKLLPFEERYSQVLKARVSIAKFLNDEVVFLEQLKAKHKELKTKQEAAKGETLNRIMDEQEQKLQKYQKNDFHPLAKTEMRYFYGAMLDFVEKEIPALTHIFRGTPEMSLFTDTFLVIERFGLSRKGLPSVRANEHIKALLDSNGNVSKIEQDTQAILKDVCIALKNMVTILGDCIQKKRISLNVVAKIDEREYLQSARLYNGKSFGKIIEAVVQKAGDIIFDFRMDSIAGFKR
ncbi:MAG: hypothetical protein K8R21_14730 [Leptospira sp.]|nr:hypothetical protein [Leptospira sp.]